MRRPPCAATHLGGGGGSGIHKSWRGIPFLSSRFWQIFCMRRWKDNNARSENARLFWPRNCARSRASASSRRRRSSSTFSHRNKNMSSQPKTPTFLVCGTPKLNQGNNELNRHPRASCQDFVLVPLFEAVGLVSGGFFLFRPGAGRVPDSPLLLLQPKDFGLFHCFFLFLAFFARSAVRAACDFNLSM